jgi:hypothetical protein
MRDRTKSTASTTDQSKVLKRALSDHQFRPTTVAPEQGT